MVDAFIICCREVNGCSASELYEFKAILDVMGQVEEV